MRSDLIERNRPPTLGLRNEPTVYALLEISSLGDGQHRFAKIESFAHELIACRSDKGFAGGQVSDEFFVLDPEVLDVLQHRRKAFSENIDWLLNFRKGVPKSIGRFSSNIHQ